MNYRKHARFRDSATIANRSVPPLLLCLLLSTVFSVSARADNIRAVGVLGNSGESGQSLVRTASYPENDHYTGVAVGDDMTVWISGGDRINRLSLSGELLESFPLKPEGSLVNSRKFAVLNETLYFFGWVPEKGRSLFALHMRSGAKVQALPVELPARSRARMPAIAAQPLGEKLVLAMEPGEEYLAVFFLDAAKGTLEEAFRVPDGDWVQGIAVDPVSERIYLGCRMGGDGYRIHAFNADGSPASENFPIRPMKTPAIPTQFRGRVSLAAGALWDGTWYGFLSRHTPEGRNAPGRIIEWNHELDDPTQVLGLATCHRRCDAVLITTSNPTALYFAHWDRTEQRLKMVRRFGCLPDILSLGLSDGGSVTVGTPWSQIWWKWEDGSDAPPRHADIHVAGTPPFFGTVRGEERCLAVAHQYELGAGSGLTLAVFTGKKWSRNEAERLVWNLPFQKPVGQSVRRIPGRNDGEIYFTDDAEKAIWATGVYIPDLRPDASKWRKLDLGAIRITSPTDLKVLTDRCILLADGGRILFLQPDGDRYRIGWEFSTWGEGPDEHFGDRLRMAVEGTWMLVSDTTRHRLIWLDWTQKHVLGQFGESDVAGADACHLHSPREVDISGSRAVVADTGNQRILKLRLSESQ